jgi:hypothetical protein
VFQVLGASGSRKYLKDAGWNPCEVVLLPVHAFPDFPCDRAASGSGNIQVLAKNGGKTLQGPGDERRREKEKIKFRSMEKVIILIM